MVFVVLALTMASVMMYVAIQVLKMERRGELYNRLKNRRGRFEKSDRS